MALYVLALSDRPAARRFYRRQPVESIALGSGVHAICQRRTEAPEPSERELLRQHALVVALTKDLSAILPVRFGTIVAAAELRRIVRAHLDEIRAALDEVRGKVQMTVRIVGRAPASPALSEMSGRAYLERKAAGIPLPRRAQRFLDAVQPLVARERREAGAGGLLATVYHLVARENVESYMHIVSRMRHGGPLVSGPWPPFAFTPRWS